MRITPVATIFTLGCVVYEPIHMSSEDTCEIGMIPSKDVPDTPGPGESESESESESGESGVGDDPCASNFPGQATASTWGPCCGAICDEGSCTNTSMGKICRPDPCDDLVGTPAEFYTLEAEKHIFFVSDGCHVPCERGQCPTGMICDDVLPGCVWPH